ncbi:MAG: hypothetical protein Q8K96_16510 [Rubrivivax sp.]|nr:hypothetical protein [Rubrivivax sp.]
MGWQGITTGLLVALCAAYSVWTLLPAALRARCWARLRGLPPPPLDGGCGGCTGCGGASPECRPDAARAKVIRIVRPDDTP